MSSSSPTRRITTVALPRVMERARSRPRLFSNSCTVNPCSSPEAPAATEKEPGDDTDMYPIVPLLNLFPPPFAYSPTAPQPRLRPQLDTHRRGDTTKERELSQVKKEKKEGRNNKSNEKRSKHDDVFTTTVQTADAVVAKRRVNKILMFLARTEKKRKKSKTYHYCVQELPITMSALLISTLPQCSWAEAKTQLKQELATGIFSIFL
ncbi:hypothetical protein TcCL_Unassigned02784, partial [Trypanosoma cruzi]